MICENICLCVLLNNIKPEAFLCIETQHSITKIGPDTQRSTLMIQTKIYGLLGIVAFVLAMLAEHDTSVVHEYVDNFEVIAHVFLLLACADWVGRTWNVQPHKEDGQ